MEHPVPQALQEHADLKDQRDRLDGRARPAYRDPQAPQVRPDHKVPRDPPENLVHKARQAPQLPARSWSCWTEPANS